jgi:hypothetical protein
MLQPQKTSNLTLGRIKLMELFADWLNKWAEAIEREGPSTWDYCLGKFLGRTSKVEKAIKSFVLYFQYDKRPDVARSLDRDYKKFYASVIKCNPTIKYLRPHSSEVTLDMVTKNAEELSFSVRQIAQMAREKLKAETEPKTPSVKEPPLAVLKNPVTCLEVSLIVRVRSDNVAAKLKRYKYPVVKIGRKNYCDAEHAGVVWPKWKNHWQNKQNR